VKLCFDKKDLMDQANAGRACTQAFTILLCNFDTTVAAPDVAHNAPFQLTVDYGDVRDQINGEDRCFGSYDTSRKVLRAPEVDYIYEDF